MNKSRFKEAIETGILVCLAIACWEAYQRSLRDKEVKCAQRRASLARIEAELNVIDNNLALHQHKLDLVRIIAERTSAQLGSGLSVEQNPPPNGRYVLCNYRGFRIAARDAQGRWSERSGPLEGVPTLWWWLPGSS